MPFGLFDSAHSLQLIPLRRRVCFAHLADAHVFLARLLRDDDSLKKLERDFAGWKDSAGASAGGAPPTLADLLARWLVSGRLLLLEVGHADLTLGTLQLEGRHYCLIEREYAVTPETAEDARFWAVGRGLDAANAAQLRSALTWHGLDGWRLADGELLESACQLVASASLLLAARPQRTRSGSYSVYDGYATPSEGGPGSRSSSAAPPAAPPHAPAQRAATATGAEGGREGDGGAGRRGEGARLSPEPGRGCGAIE
jgi:hypothetical protein